MKEVQYSFNLAGGLCFCRGGGAVEPCFRGKGHMSYVVINVKDL